MEKSAQNIKKIFFFLHRRWNLNEFLMYYISSLLFVFACIFFLPLTFNKRFTTWNLKFFSLHRVCMFIFISFLCSTALLLLQFFFSSLTLHFFFFHFTLYHFEAPFQCSYVAASKEFEYFFFFFSRCSAYFSSSSSF